ncbi:Uma2 family endonuclease [Chroococcidiopsis sp. CCMEE 29]|uniref:Uma2 family endonuclease n=1 Tax=Chroococcidiopsis sp. CCMEE 29 TaxID=155894 RepID=UPI002020503B|nr:Uma2 family endonuclease [Chroococcidiopsis sp. CCMEE 29]
MATVLDLSPIIHLTHEQFYQLCLANRDVAMERSPKGELIIVTPVGGEGGIQEASLIVKVGVWNEQTGLGVVFSSSTIFNLPGGGDRSPDVAWVKRNRWESLSQTEREKFPPICPDFVIELRSRTDRLTPVQEKMQEYLQSGLRLGWLINPQDRQVEIYRPNQPVETLTYPVTLSGEDVLPGFSLPIF